LRNSVHDTRNRRGVTDPISYEVFNASTLIFCAHEWRFQSMSEEVEEDHVKPPTTGAGDTHKRMTSLPVQVAGLGHDGFVQPSSYLRRPRGISKPMPAPKVETAVDREQRKGLVCSRRCLRVNFEEKLIWPQQSIRAFLKVRTSYDVLPLSFRLIVFDTNLLVKKSLNILIQNGESRPGGMDFGGFTNIAGIVSAPLWDSKRSTFAGLLTTSDFINVIQYYCLHPEEMSKIDQFRLNSLRGRSREWSVVYNGLSDLSY